MLPTLSVRLLGGVALGVIASPVIAQSQADGGRPVEDIVVTGAGLPVTPATPAYSTTLLDREALSSTGSGRIEDGLASVAGFQQFRRSDSRSSNPSAQGATLRALGGNATSRALVLLDGVPMTDPFFGYIPFSAIAPERLASARVTRGGGSGAFGAGALAGTIELTSADAATLGALGGSVLINDRAESESTLTVAPRLGGGFAIASARWDRGAGFFTTPPNQRVPATARARYDAWSVQARAVAPVAQAVELQARILAYRDERTLRFEGAETAMEGQDASLRLVGRGRWQFDVLAYVQARSFTNVVVSAATFRPALDQRNTPATGLGGKIEVRPPTGSDNVLRIGADYRQSSGELFETAFNAATGAVTQRRNAGGTTRDLGLFVEDDLALGAVILTGGARVDRTVIRDGFFIARGPTSAVVSQFTYPDRTKWTASFRGGTLFNVTEALRMRAAAYTGLRLPTLNELYRPFTVFPVTTQANAGLVNERIQGIEAGIDYALATGFDLSFTAFDNRVKNAIANVTIGTNLRERQNIDAIRARGIEASAAVRRGALRFDASLAATDAEARDNGTAAALDGKRPAQTPAFAASATVGWRFAGNGLASITLRHVGLQFEDDLETDRLPAATTIDAYARLQLSGRASIVIRGENLTGETIVTRNQGGSIDIGTPRTLWAGISMGL